ncbi:MAG: 2-amino-4-hydroxy-6-hydroxymethyldihydropteridine diphosphokinase [Chloroflexi bacterium]|nr:2-amino-4-hydroxy-6-hydroxymethyldihydropteridine diphosphokinase [Chloroflexota bacterium]
MKTTCALGLGSNLGDRLAYLQRAVEAIEARGIEVRKLSPVYETEPVGFMEQPRFLNAVSLAATDLDAHALLAAVKAIERELGRRPTFKGGPRVIDIDILFYEELVLDAEELVIPHPGLHQRAFVLVPLADVAPDWFHPVLKRSVRELLAQVKGREGVRLAGTVPLPKGMP